MNKRRWNYVFDILAFVIASSALYYWHFVKNDFDDFNTFVILKFNSKLFFHYYKLILVIFWVNFIPTFICLVLPRRINKLIFIWRYFAFSCNLLFLTILSILWPNEWVLIHKSFQFYFVFHNMWICVITFLISRRLLQKSNNKTLKLGFTYGITIFFPFILAILYKSPCTLSIVPAKPFLIAHRGAQYISPENTILSYETALNICNVEKSSSLIALETDIQVSLDGIPFLLHDPYLTRTTNVRKLFPTIFKQYAFLFNFTDQLKFLNAGSWFLKENPFKNSRKLPSSIDLSVLRNQSLPLFLDYVKTAKLAKKSIIFDLKFPEGCLENVIPSSINLITNGHPLIRDAPKSIHLNNFGHWDWNTIANVCQHDASFKSLTSKFRHFLTATAVADRLKPPPADLTPNYNLNMLKEPREEICSAFRDALTKCEHPYAPILNRLILYDILSTKIPHEQVWWILDSRFNDFGINPLINQFPNFTYVFPDPIPVENLTALNVTKLNLGNYEINLRSIKYYRRYGKNISINVYVVNQLWLFSYYWCAGIDSVTTGRCHFFSKHIKPLLVMSSTTYFITVIATQIIIFIVLILFLSHNNNYFTSGTRNLIQKFWHRQPNHQIFLLIFHAFKNIF